MTVWLSTFFQVPGFTGTTGSSLDVASESLYSGLWFTWTSCVASGKSFPSWGWRVVGKRWWKRRHVVLPGKWGAPGRTLNIMSQFVKERLPSNHHT